MRVTSNFARIHKKRLKRDAHHTLDTEPSRRALGARGDYFLRLFRSALSGAALLTPTSYLCFDGNMMRGCGSADSLYSGATLGYFHLQTVEVTRLNVPGGAATGYGMTSAVCGAALRDSVDSADAR
jgi:hypothetical protein